MREEPTHHRVTIKPEQIEIKTVTVTGEQMDGFIITDPHMNSLQVTTGPIDHITIYLDNLTVTQRNELLRRVEFTYNTFMAEVRQSGADGS